MAIVLILVSSVAFLYYGVIFFSHDGMKEEFDRYQLAGYRALIGWLQLLGGVGLLLGLLWRPILILSSGGLALLMGIGFGIRLKMKDGLLASLPSLVLMIVNLYICLAAIGFRFLQIM